jgi:hypothetical protein
MGTGGPFPGGKAQKGRDADQSPQAPPYVFVGHLYMPGNINYEASEKYDFRTMQLQAHTQITLTF